MKGFINLNVLMFVLAVLLAGYLISPNPREWPLYAIGLLAGFSVAAAGGAWTSYLWFKRGKVYEERGQSGPDR